MLLKGLRWSGDEEKRGGVEAKREEEAPRGNLATDGGASYRAAALRRAIEEARASGRGLEDVVAERWGSLDALTGGESIEKVLSSAPPARRAALRRKEERAPLKASPGDAEMLEQYARALGDALDRAISGGKGDRKPPSPLGESGWVGLAPRGFLSSGSSGGSFETGWRRRDDEPPPPTKALRTSSSSSSS